MTSFIDTTVPAPHAATESEAQAAVLTVRDLTVQYSRSGLALQGVSLQVHRGEVLAVIGPNGAGKTTLARSITGFMSAESAKITGGEVVLLGRSVCGRSPDQISRAGAALVAEREKVMKALTVEEHFTLLGLRAEPAYERFPALAERRKLQAGFLSGGQRQALALSLAIARSPALLVVDELTLGLSPTAITTIVAAVKDRLVDSTMAVIIIEQNASIAMDLADRLMILESGRVAHEGTPADFREAGDVAEFYLGRSDEQSYTEIKQYKESRRWWA